MKKRVVLFLIVLISALSVGFEPTVFSLEVTNGFNIPVIVLAREINRDGSTFTSSVTYPLELSPGAKGQMRFVGVGSNSCIRGKETKPYYFYATDKAANIVYERYFALSELKDMGFKLTIGP